MSSEHLATAIVTRLLFSQIFFFVAINLLSVLPIIMAEDNLADVVLPTLKNIQADIAVIKKQVGRIKVVQESIARIDGTLASMDDHLSAYHRSDNLQNNAIDELRGRVEALERQSKDDPKP